MKDSLRKIILYLLTCEAKWVLKKYTPRIIAITGSVGKTSTKDAAFTALKGSHFVRKSEKSYNGDIGVPLTILGVPNGWSNIFVWFQNLFKGLLLLILRMPYPQWLILELGADRPGDISRSLSWIRPDVVVTTRFPEVPVHVEFYDSPDAVIKEELFPLQMLTSGGVAVMHQDDPHATSVSLPEGVRTITYGTDKGASVRGMRYRITSRKGVATGISFDITHEDQKAHIVIPGIVGAVHMQAVLAGVASALAAHVSLEQAVKGFDSYTFPAGRLRIIPGIKESLIIDDSYNASPVATEEALRTLHSAPTKGKRIAVLGDMLELGKFSVQEHARMGNMAADYADIIVAIGVRARAIAEAARAQGVPESRVHFFDNTEETVKFLQSFIENSDVILVKGSQGMRMERIVKEVMRTPEDAARVLARQDAEWLLR